jgi:hypothetical protein
MFVNESKVLWLKLCRLRMELGMIPPPPPYFGLKVFETGELGLGCRGKVLKRKGWFSGCFVKYSGDWGYPLCGCRKN